MATALELAFEKAITQSLYKTCGISVTYKSIVTGNHPTEVIPSNGSQLFSNQFEIQTNERTQSARVLKSVINQPYRGDQIVNSDDEIFEVDDYSQENAIEWNLILTVCSNG